MFTQDNIDRIIGSEVIDQNGDKIGSVGQVFLDDRTNQPSWVTVNTGFFGNKETFIPIADANFDGDALRVGYEKGFVKDAPNVDVENGHLSVDEEAELYRYYRLEHGTAVAGEREVAGERREAVADRDVHTHGDLSTAVHEERLNVGTEQVEAGRVRLRKYVTTENQQINVPVTKEKLVIDRQPVEGGRVVEGGIDRNQQVVDEEITLREERPVVSKETVETERVNIGKQQVTETQAVQGEVAKEHVEVEGVEGVERDIRH